MTPGRALAAAHPRIGPAEMAVFTRLAHSRGALAIGTEKTDFLVARLSPRGHDCVLS